MITESFGQGCLGRLQSSEGLEVFRWMVAVGKRLSPLPCSHSLGPLECALRRWLTLSGPRDSPKKAAVYLRAGSEVTRHHFGNVLWLGVARPYALPRGPH